MYAGSPPPWRWATLLCLAAGCPEAKRYTTAVGGDVTDATDTTGTTNAQDADADADADTDVDVDSDADADADADTDADADADTDTDADADTGTPGGDGSGDTGTPGPYDGRYTGTITSEADVFLIGEVHCTGTVEIDVDASASTMISGGGPLSCDVGTGTVTLLGALTTDPEAAGTVRWEIPSIQLSDSMDWTGAFGAGDLRASGTGTLAAGLVYIEGELVAYRQ